MSDDLPSGVSTGPVVYGLEHVPLPAAACDADGRVVWANDRLREVLGKLQLGPGSRLADFVPDLEPGGTALRELAVSDEAPRVVQIADSVHAIYVGPAGEDGFACLFSPVDAAGRPSAPSMIPERPRAESEPPAGIQLLEAFITLSRQLNLTMRRSELVQIFARTYEELFPNRQISIRLVDPETLELADAYANARLREDRRDRFVISADAWDSQSTDCPLLDELEADGYITRATGGYEPVFHDTEDGFDLILCDGQQFYGALNFEYAAGAGSPQADRPLVAPLNHLMCASLRNARLLTESMFLKDYLEKLLDRANAPVLVIDRERRLTVVNQALERLIGYRREDLLGEDFLAMIPDVEQARLLPAVINAYRGEPTSNIEVRIPRADRDGAAHIVFNTATIHSARGDVEGVIFVGQDLTEIRTLQRQIIHSEKLATLGQVAAGVAHELNNPLTSISVYAGYLVSKLDGAIDEAELAKLKRIVDAAGRIQSFTKDLVTYARPSGEEPKLIKVSELIDRALSFCEHLITENEADVTVDVADGLDPIYGIRGQMEQVLVNLLTNACHALQPGGGQISVSARPIDEERIQLVIRDSGCGVPEEHLGRVFEPFFTTKQEGHGTGLGLSIVRNILVNHNGDIEVASEPGKGTAFTITMYSG